MIVDGAGQTVMTEVAGALMVIETTGAAELAVLQDTHAGIRETPNLTVLRAVVRHLHHGASCDLIGSKHTELNANNGFCL
jgi:hypothetical protein